MSNRGRSWLIVPLSKPAAVEAAAASGADVVVLDLVEYVADTARPAVRAQARAVIERLARGGQQVYVQTTPAAGGEDLPACVGTGLTGVVLSRTESAAEVRRVDGALAALEREHRLATGALTLVLALETARGNQDAQAIVNASRRVRAITLGRVDLVMDLRPEPSGEMHMMPYLMQRLVILAGAAGVTPLGAWWRAPDRGLLATPDSTLKAAQRGRAMGFKGALCLRADQVTALNSAYA